MLKLPYNLGTAAVSSTDTSGAGGRHAYAHAARADAVMDAYEASKRTVSLFSFSYGQLV